MDRLLAGQGAHADFDAAVAGFPEKLQGTRPPGAPHSAWELLEHLRLAQLDMLEFSRNPKHVSAAWPEGYWPKGPEPANAAAWDQSVKSFQHRPQRHAETGFGSEIRPFYPFTHGDGQTLLREALQLADHNAYHVGELIFLRRLLGAWKCEMSRGKRHGHARYAGYRVCRNLREGLRRPGANITSRELIDYLRELNDDDCARQRETSDLSVIVGIAARCDYKSELINLAGARLSHTPPVQLGPAGSACALPS